LERVWFRDATPWRLPFDAVLNPSAKALDILPVPNIPHLIVSLIKKWISYESKGSRHKQENIVVNVDEFKEIAEYEWHDD
jgi:hypothetical protein